MMASEFIQALRALVDEFGDLEVVNDESDYVNVEHSPADTENEAAFVIS